ncbi:MAG: carboxy terminal-processing peptidase [Gammaproteobacteria bacterium]|nr:carboxy terminal-processing peptidase [Gammaproteobacteria bacterium]MBU1654032.1 carboxy terminal-processing peptidase [Gammaproteobacteria bacterium]MBU1959701.1 carboxy terminal-processing peptidase [Gammaproteobacteria bacterium]
MMVRIGLLALLWPLAVPQAATNNHEVNPAELIPTPSQRQTAVIITKVMERHHVRKVELDDKLSREIFKHYLETLDPNRSFFTQEDINGFSKYEERLDDALITAELDAPFDIFRIYRDRVEREVGFALRQLGQKHDYSIDEDYRFDRSKAPWAANNRELDDVWRKRVKNDILSLRLLGKPEGEILKTLHKRYEATLTQVRQFNRDDVFQTFANAYTMSLEPHTSYMSPQLSENFDISMRLSLEGIGAVLRSRNEYTEIMKTVPGGPADLSGQVQKGDRIVGVGQGKSGEIENVLGWRLQDVVDKIRGPKGSVVRLEVLPKGAAAGGSAKVIALVRNEIKLEDQAAKKSVIQGMEGMQGRKIGVIEIPAFYRDFQGQSSGDKNFRSTTRDVRKLLKELNKERVDGIVIDLRQNGGGSLTEATELTGLFIDKGPVVQVLDSSGRLEIERDKDPEIAYRGPLAVLVDGESASASEIFAGAIQDYGRGIIIGEPTFGKGTVQTLIDLDRFVRGGDTNLGRLRLTMAQFFRVSGSSTQFKGVVPDVLYPNSESDKEHGERSLDNALPWSSIEPVRKVTQIRQDKLNILTEHHRARIAVDPGFGFLNEGYRISKEQRDRHSLSLKESKRREEWRKTELARRASENRFRSSVGLKPLPENIDMESEQDDEEGIKAISKIQLNEAARLLADYINLGQARPAVREAPRAAMIDF